jgi:diacylglycerol kinase
MRQSFLTSLQRAGRGLFVGFASEPNIRRELAVTLVVFALFLTLPLVQWERAAVMIVVGLVLVVEFVNTAMERLLNVVKPQFHEDVRDIKDMTAGATLIASFVAAAIGLLVFGPYALFLIRHV